eukprot:gene12931-17333_t
MLLHSKRLYSSQRKYAKYTINFPISKSSVLKYSSQSANTTNKRPKRQSDLSKLLYGGLPMIILIIGGSYFLSVFTSTHVELKDRHNSSVSTRKFDIEQEHKEILKNLDIDNYKLSRIPRPEDETDSK